MTKRIAFQGELGSYSHQACFEARPDYEPLPCPTFEDAMEAVRSERADIGMIAIENSTYGRVQDVYHLLPDSGLHIIGETFVRVHVNLLGLPGSKTADIKQARAMSVLLGQARKFIHAHGIETVNWSDNAAAARSIKEDNDPSIGAFASELAGEILGLDVLERHIEDHKLNTTRFLIMAREPDYTRRAEKMVTAFMFRVRNIPAALYKALGGFATNGVNMTKLESYMVDGVFTATQFYADIEGHPGDRNVQLALDELRYFTEMVEILGVYPADPRRS
ncbi:prephenate dehydratase [Celeribacter ethanolicus]|uniref:prephenate dehydratase n=1 Tax=Celeribacter ethanolicus TaxID=1758178 RepID=A0A291GD47_9RHOB|nr:prephenate dehydratase [Celeribacter ethanolicus]ATG47990.1 prephenate dehydratase [Celeribacter ethanolicus]TNE66457.1 MAG: prephenate dehydratase [Paracoccaceae bacterium]